MDSAALRLQNALSKVDRLAFVSAAKATGMDKTVVAKAFNGNPVPALAYMRLCAMCAIDAVTGAPLDVSRYPQRIAWPGVAAALTAYRKHNSLTIQSAADRAHVSRSTLGDASLGTPVNTESFLAICVLLARSPESFLSFARVDVSYETRTRKSGRECQSEARP